MNPAVFASFETSNCHQGSRPDKHVLRSILAALAIALSSCLAQAEADSVVIVVGAAGTPEYGDQFKDWAERWTQVCESSNSLCTVIGTNPISADRPDRELLRAAIESHAAGEMPLWLVMIGHGTPFGDGAKFNLRGPDVSSDVLAGWLKTVERRVAIVNCTSASGPFLKALSGEKRVVVTATQSGAEINFARFGEYFSSAISSREADLDHDDQVSLLEAYLTASKNVQRFYDDDDRLATEHALLDDNGDGQGTPTTFFQGIRATKSAKDGSTLDGTVAHHMILLKSERETALTTLQVTARDKLESELELLLSRKSDIPVDDYYGRLETIMIQIAKIYGDR